MHAVAFTIKRAHLRTTDMSKRCVRRFGLTPARYDMLYALWKFRAKRQRDLWAIFHVSRTTVSRMLAALETLGLVRRDRRQGRSSRSVELTEMGLHVIRDAVRGCHRALCLLFESFYPRVRGRLDRACKVSELHDRIAAVAHAFGDRSRFTYPYNHPEDVYPYTPDPTDDWSRAVGASSDAARALLPRSLAKSALPR